MEHLLIHEYGKSNDRITIGVRDIHIYEIHAYYRAVQNFNFLPHKAFITLNSYGMQAVKKKMLFNRQLGVDAVYFKAIKERCYPMLLPRVECWHQVYTQFSASRTVPFRRLFLSEWRIDLHPSDKKKVMAEVRLIYDFFKILNFRDAAWLSGQFVEHLDHFPVSGSKLSNLPDVYPYALNGNPRILPALLPGNSNVLASC